MLFRTIHHICRVLSCETGRDVIGDLINCGCELGCGGGYCGKGGKEGLGGGEFAPRTAPSRTNFGKHWGLGDMEGGMGWDGGGLGRCLEVYVWDWLLVKKKGGCWRGAI